MFQGPRVLGLGTPLDRFCRYYETHEFRRHTSSDPGIRPSQLFFNSSSSPSIKISYSETSQQNPDLASESSRLVIAEFDLSHGAPALINKKIVYESKDRSCTLEAQDFYEGDDKMTFTCYEPRAQASVMGIDLRTGVVTNFSKAPGSYNEVEGIFPDGLYAAVEADRQREQLGGTRGSVNIDIWKLKLDDQPKAGLLVGARKRNQILFRGMRHDLSRRTRS